jgi:hypothetical protein
MSPESAILCGPGIEHRTFVTQRDAVHIDLYPPCLFAGTETFRFGVEALPSGGCAHGHLAGVC